MAFGALVICFVIFHCIVCNEEQMQQKFTESKIVPDVVDKAPTKLLQVTYENGGITTGQEIPPSQASTQPKLSFPTKDDAYYTVVMVDADIFLDEREWLHWLVVNVPGTSINEGNTVQSYLKPGPPRGTGLHRYVFLVFEQTRQLDTSSPATRKSFNTRKYAATNDLGDPVAGNYFFAQFQE